MTHDRDTVRSRYATAAGSSCDPMIKGGGTCGATHYAVSDNEDLPVSLLNLSLGCANPVAVADLRQGEIVLDLGSGAGFDVLISARRVAPAGIAYGLDMTDEMLDLARRNAAEAGVTNVVFLKGYIEDIPLPATSVDVILSNCVIGLSLDKPEAFTEMARVVRRGGRIAIADIVADSELEPVSQSRLESESPCLASALTRETYRSGLEEAGFDRIEITDSHEAAPGFTSTIVRAAKQ